MYLTAAEEVRERKGEFAGRYFDTNLKPVSPSKLASDPEIARNLWELSEKTVGKWTTAHVAREDT